MNTDGTVFRPSIATIRRTKRHALYLGLCALGVGLSAGAQEAAAASR